MRIPRSAISTIAAFSLSISLLGCVSVTPVIGPGGEQAHAITCSGGERDWARCFERAGEICGTGGYNILNQASDQSGFIAGNQDFVSGSSSASQTLLIACKAGQTAQQ